MKEAKFSDCKKTIPNAAEKARTCQACGVLCHPECLQPSRIADRILQFDHRWYMVCPKCRDAFEQQLATDEELRDRFYLYERLQQVAYEDICFDPPQDLLENVYQGVLECPPKEILEIVKNDYADELFNEIRSVLADNLNRQLAKTLNRKNIAITADELEAVVEAAISDSAESLSSA